MLPGGITVAGAVAQHAVEDELNAVCLDQGQLAGVVPAVERANGLRHVQVHVVDRHHADAERATGRVLVEQGAIQTQRDDVGHTQIRCAVHEGAAREEDRVAATRRRRATCAGPHRAAASGAAARTRAWAGATATGTTRAGPGTATT